MVKYGGLLSSHAVSVGCMIQKETLREVCLRVLWFCPLSVPLHGISVLFLSSPTDAVQSELVSVSLTLKIIKIYCVSPFTSSFWFWCIFALFYCMLSRNYYFKSRITMAKATFNKKMALFTNTLDLKLRKTPVKCYIWSIALYGAETWTLRAVDQKHMESFEMCRWRRMEIS